MHGRLRLMMWCYALTFTLVWPRYDLDVTFTFWGAGNFWKMRKFRIVQSNQPTRYHHTFYLDLIDKHTDTNKMMPRHQFSFFSLVCHDKHIDTISTNNNLDVNSIDNMNNFVGHHYMEIYQLIQKYTSAIVSKFKSLFIVKKIAFINKTNWFLSFFPFFFFLIKCKRLQIFKQCEKRETSLEFFGGVGLE